jgi:hypothetical protein
MKAKVTSKPAFSPITIEVVLESERDLADLWHRLNIGALVVNENSSRVSTAWQASMASGLLWEELDKIALERGFIE